MKRRLLNLVAGLSLLLCAAVVLLWVQSYRNGGSTFPRQPAPASTYLHSVRGVLRLRVCDRTRPKPLVGSGVSGMAVYRRLPDETELRAGHSPHRDNPVFGYGLVQPVTGTDDRGKPLYAQEFIPFWSESIGHRHALLIAGALPLCWLISLAWRQRRDRRRRDRVERGLCPACGYDVRASPQRCPECGTVPTGGGGAAA